MFLIYSQVDLKILSNGVLPLCATYSRHRFLELAQIQAERLSQGGATLAKVKSEVDVLILKDGWRATTKQIGI